MRKTAAFRALAVILAALLALLSFAACAENPTQDPIDTTPSADDTPAGVVKKDKRIAFTFDDGPTPGVTGKILDKLEELDGRATFFQVGNRHNYIDNATYSRLLSLGCEVGTHTFSHPSNLKSMSETAFLEQLNKSIDEIEAETGKTVNLFRPVGGAISAEQLELAASLGLHTVNWNLDTEDWKEQTSDIESVEDFINEKVDYIVNNAADGDIILMHELYLSSYEIFSRAADKLTEMGYELVTVSEILEIDENSVPEAKVHNSGNPMFIPNAKG